MDSATRSDTAHPGTQPRFPEVVESKDLGAVEKIVNGTDASKEEAGLCRAGGGAGKFPVPPSQGVGLPFRGLFLRFFLCSDV